MLKEEIAKHEIVRRAQVLFERYGLKKTTMDEIARGCGKAKSTMYHYFKSKEEVFEEVIHLEITNLRSKVKNQVEQEEHIKDKISVYFLTFHSIVINKSNLYNSLCLNMLHESRLSMGNDQNKHTLMVKKIMDFECDYVERILYDAYNSGEFTKIQKEDIPHFAETLIAAFFGVMSYSTEKDSLKDFYKIEKTTNLLIHQIFS